MCAASPSQLNNTKYTVDAYVHLHVHVYITSCDRVSMNVLDDVVII